MEVEREREEIHLARCPRNIEQRTQGKAMKDGKHFRLCCMGEGTIGELEAIIINSISQRPEHVMGPVFTSACYTVCVPKDRFLEKACLKLK